jgi:DNA-binding transcriptional regulator YdaS (Cro superfamily)
MTSEKPRPEIVVRVLEAAGGVRSLAQQLSVSESAVSQWRGIPPHRVLEVERITGISRHELCPKLYPAEDGRAA